MSVKDFKNEKVQEFIKDKDRIRAKSIVKHNLTNLGRIGNATDESE